MITCEQQSIIDQPANAKMLVTAGAGTGKTFTLLYRAKKLIERDRLHAGGEILVLSFSRSAVKEIRQRVGALGGDLSYLRARTFDSFATRLLATVHPDGDWARKDYDARIASAIEIICANNNANAFLQSFRHIIVDEIQDLVGIRSKLVQCLVTQNDRAGFTFFGDPAQGIYNFSASGEERSLGCAVLYAWLRTNFCSCLVEKTLTKNFRAATKSAAVALWAGKSLNSREPDFTAILGELTAARNSLPTIADVSTLVRGLGQAYTGRTAVLCRNNGEALYISDKLRSSKVDHRLQAAATDRIVSPWLAVCLGAMPSRLIGKSTFVKAYPTSAQQWLAPEEAWRILRRIDRGSTSVDLSAIATKLRNGDVPDEIVVDRKDCLVVSTIHRAKGLEFDRVFVLYDPPPNRDYDESDDADRARLFYVALTRAKRDLFRLDSLNNVFLALNKDADRWRVPVRFSKYKTRALEIRTTDSKSDVPAGYGTSSASELQQYIRDRVHRGDSVILNRVPMRIGDDILMQYGIQHGEKTVGFVDGAGIHMGLKVFRDWKVVMPLRITDVYVEEIDSVAGLQGSAQASGLGFADIWLRVRVAGLGMLEYSEQELNQVRRR